MIYSQNDLLKRILDTRAVSIWDRTKGPVFWYAANVPGPFYVNTEMVIGKEISEHLLKEITALIADTSDAKERVERLTKLVMGAYNTASEWQKLIATMVDKGRTEFPAGSYAMISGGERRDWLFSIPFAYEAKRQHLFLFKDGSVYSDAPIIAGQSVLHVSDLINNAASFFELWQPILEKNKLRCCGNLCVNVRGEAGLKRLTEAGQKTVSLMTIDVDFFRKLQDANLITRETVDEIAAFFKSSQEWASKYLLDKPALFNVESCEKKSFERLQAFIEHDPWKMKPTHQAFFEAMKKAIDQRVAKKPTK